MFPDCPDFLHGCECCYLGSGAMPGSGRGSKIRKNIKTKRKIVFCLIVFGGSSRDLYGYFTKGVRKKQGTSVGAVLLEALALRFIHFGESDIHPRPIQARRIEGPGRG